MNVWWQDHKLDFIGSYHSQHLASLIARIQNNDFLEIDNIWGCSSSSLQFQAKLTLNIHQEDKFFKIFS